MKLMLIIGSDQAIAEISTKLQELASKEWYFQGTKEYDCDVKIINFDEITDFHLG